MEEQESPADPSLGLVQAPSPDSHSNRREVLKVMVGDHRLPARALLGLGLGLGQGCRPLWRKGSWFSGSPPNDQVLPMPSQCGHTGVPKTSPPVHAHWGSPGPR